MNYKERCVKKSYSHYRYFVGDIFIKNLCQQWILLILEKEGLEKQSVGCKI